MATKTKPIKEVLSLIEQCSRMYGRYKEEDLNQDLFHACLDMDSPIEQILYCALEAIRRIETISTGYYELVNGNPVKTGLFITPQFPIDKYRVDFFVSYKWAANCDTALSEKQVIVECDSQQFHERTERERRYEKGRDRFLHTKGYTVFHYTGKEIIEDPFRVASEIIAFLTNQDAIELLKWVKEYK